MGTTLRQPAVARSDQVVPEGVRVRVLRATLADPLRVASLVASETWLDRAEVLKLDRRSTVLAGRIDALPAVVKSLRLDRIKDLLSRLFGTTRGARQWRGAMLLNQRGFAVPEQIVLFRGRGIASVETLVMERVEGPTLLEVIAGRAPSIDAAAPRLARLAALAGELVAAMSRAGLRNRDLKPSNVIVVPASPAVAAHRPYTLVQIDTVGVEQRTDADRAEMLFRLLVECVGTGNTPRRALRWRAALAATDNEPARARVLWRDVEARLRRHGDPTPRVNPLA